MAAMGECREVKSKVIVTNENLAATTGTARAIVQRISSLLHVGIFLAYFTRQKVRPASFAGNSFDLYGRVANVAGEFVRLSPTPINNGGTGNQAAPDGYEGSTLLPEIEVEFDFTGITQANCQGTWQVIVIAEPAEPMEPDLFKKLASAINIEVVTAGAT